VNIKKLILPIVKREPEGYLVYSDKELLTPLPITLENARLLFNLELELFPKKRVQILSAHILEHPSSTRQTRVVL
jgi:hypothetical protein